MNFKEAVFKAIGSAIVLILAEINIAAREVITLQTGWKFSKGTIENAARSDFDDSKWEDVIVPHDWAIYGPVIPNGDGNTGKLLWREEGWYRIDLEIDPDWTGKTIYVLFDGVMSNPEIFVNGQLAGKWDYGYNSFYFDITPWLNFNGSNSLAVHVDNRNHDSRWYPGAGIYRKVQLVVTEPVHIGIWGTQITTPIVKSHFAEVRIMTSVINKSANSEENVRVENIILNADGKELGRETIEGNLKSKETKGLETTIGLINPQRWDLDNPVLYSVKPTVYKGKQITDTHNSTFGVRTIRFTADHGFYLNDKQVQLNVV